MRRRSLSSAAMVLFALVLPSGCFLDRGGRAAGSDAGEALDGGPRPDGGRVDGGGVDGGSRDGGNCTDVELCNGLDEDCDGTVDESTAAGCGIVGTCSEGMRACTDGALGECEPLVPATAEACEGAIDEDCDGTVDEGCECTEPGATQGCGSSEGACEQGTQTCGADGTWGTCEGGVAPAAETCNGVDDDCDGTVDMIDEACGSDTGACTAGTRTCTAGTWGACSDVGPTAETCNGIDDDCDGVTDGFDETCGMNQGICTEGTRTCTAGTFGACSGTSAGTEACDTSGRDEDCDGNVDEGCTCLIGGTGPCTVGGCAGTRRCIAGGIWGSCMATASAETCNGRDDDCDGAIDNGVTCSVGPDNCRVVRSGGSTYQICEAGALSNASWSEARAICMGFGYDLVEIGSEAEQDFLEMELATQTEVEWWIGLTDTTGVDRDYRWVGSGMTPAEVGYDNWASDNPSNNDQCTMMDMDQNNGEWDDKGCGGGRAFVCEVRP